MKMALKRGLIVVVGLLLQILSTLFIYLFFIEHIVVIDVLFGIISILLTLGFIRKSKNYSYTLPLIIILVLFPIVGALLYIIFQRNKRGSKTLKNIKKSEIENQKYLVQDKKLKAEYKDNGKIRYLSDFTGYPVLSYW